MGGQQLYELWQDVHTKLGLEPPEKAWVHLDWTEREAWGRLAREIERRTDAASS